MNRGPGKIQKRILDAVKRYRALYLASLTDDLTTEYKSLHRAAIRLWENGQIGVFQYQYGHRKLVVYDLGDPPKPIHVRKVVKHFGVIDFDTLDLDRKRLETIHKRLRTARVAARSRAG